MGVPVALVPGLEIPAAVTSYPSLDLLPMHPIVRMPIDRLGWWLIVSRYRKFSRDYSGLLEQIPVPGRLGRDFDGVALQF